MSSTTELLLETPSSSEPLRLRREVEEDASRSCARRLRFFPSPSRGLSPRGDRLLARTLVSSQFSSKPKRGTGGLPVAGDDICFSAILFSFLSPVSKKQLGALGSPTLFSRSSDPRADTVYSRQWYDFPGFFVKLVSEIDARDRARGYESAGGGRRGRLRLLLFV